MCSSTATSSATPPCDAIAGLICSSSTCSTRCATSPERSAVRSVGQRSARRDRPVGVLHHHAAVELERGAAEQLGAVGGNRDGEVVVVLDHDVPGSSATGRNSIRYV